MELFEEAHIGNIKLKNRIVRSATFEGAANENGFPTASYFNIYKQLASHGVAGIITGFTYIRLDGKAMHPGQAGCDSPDKVAAYQPITDMVHANNCRIFMQIAHTGRQTLASATGGQPVGASSKKSFYFNQQPHVLSADEVYHLVGAFGDAALVAKNAGFDGVQLHAAHGYLIHQFLHPSVNNRGDEFGIDKETRIGTRFLEQIIIDVRHKCGDGYPVLVKISGSDDLAKPFSDAQFKHLIRFLDRMKVAAIELSYGTMEMPFNIFRGGFPVDDILKHNGIYKNKNSWGKWMAKHLVFPILKKRTIAFAPSYNLPYADVARSLTKIPLMVVGGFRNKAQMDEAVSGHGIDFVSLCRPFIAEPNFVEEIINNSIHQSRCTNCNRCAVMCDSGRATHCYEKQGRSA